MLYVMFLIVVFLFIFCFVYSIDAYSLVQHYEDAHVSRCTLNVLFIIIIINYYYYYIALVWTDVKRQHWLIDGFKQ